MIAFYFDNISALYQYSSLNGVGVIRSETNVTTVKSIRREDPPKNTAFSRSIKGNADLSIVETVICNIKVCPTVTFSATASGNNVMNIL